MKTTIITTMLFILAIGTLPAFADEVTVEIPSGDYEARGCTWVDFQVVSCNFYYPQTLEEFVSTVGDYVATDDPESITVKIAPELVDEYLPLVEAQTQPEDDDVYQVPERHEEIKKALQEKENQIVAEALKCLYGTGGEGLFVEARETLILKQMEYFKHLPSNQQEKKLIQWTEECRAWKGYHSSGDNNPRYANIASALAEVTVMEYPVLGDTKLPSSVDETDRERENIKARETQLELQWYNDPYGEFPGINKGGYSEGKACGDIPPQMTTEGRITKAGVTACPVKDKQTYLSGTIETTIKEHQSKTCLIAWKNSAQFGDRSPVWWREMLKDGSCDEYIPEIAEKRAEHGYTYKVWKHQNTGNCPDCPQFKEATE